MSLPQASTFSVGSNGRKGSTGSKLRQEKGATRNGSKYKASQRLSRDAPSLRMPLGPVHLNSNVLFDNAAVAATSHTAAFQTQDGSEARCNEARSNRGGPGTAYDEATRPKSNRSCTTSMPSFLPSVKVKSGRRSSVDSERAGVVKQRPCPGRGQAIGLGGRLG